MARSLKLKATKFCVMKNKFYWKDTGGLLLNCLAEDEAKKILT